FRSLTGAKRPSAIARYHASDSTSTYCEPILPLSPVPRAPESRRDFTRRAVSAVSLERVARRLRPDRFAPWERGNRISTAAALSHALLHAVPSLSLGSVTKRGGTSTGRGRCVSPRGFLGFVRWRKHSSDGPGS